MTACDATLERLSPLLDDVLPAAEREAALAHLAACEACAVEHDALAQAEHLLGALPRLELPQALVESTLARARAVRGAGSAPRTAGAARPGRVVVTIAAVAAALLAALALAPGEPPASRTLADQEVAPARDAAPDAPARDAATDAPARDAAPDAPARDAATDAPARDTPAPALAPDAASDGGSPVPAHDAPSGPGLVTDDAPLAPPGAPTPPGVPTPLWSPARDEPAVVEVHGDVVHDGLGSGTLMLSGTLAYGSTGNHGQGVLVNDALLVSFGVPRRPGVNHTLDAGQARVALAAHASLVARFADQLAFVDARPSDVTVLGANVVAVGLPELSDVLGANSGLVPGHEAYLERSAAFLTTLADPPSVDPRAPGLTTELVGLANATTARLDVGSPLVVSFQTPGSPLAPSPEAAELYALGLRRWACGDPAGAASALQEYLERVPGAPDQDAARFWLARASAAQGDAHGAATNYLAVVGNPTFAAAATDGFGAACSALGETTLSGAPADPRTIDRLTLLGGARVEVRTPDGATLVFTRSAPQAGETAR